jgi:hypothetical protein
MRRHPRFELRAFNRTPIFALRPTAEEILEAHRFSLSKTASIRNAVPTLEMFRHRFSTEGTRDAGIEPLSILD